MATRDNPTLQAFEQILEKWTDVRFLSREDLRTFYMYDMYLVNLMDDEGLVWRGHTYKNGSPLGLLVVKAVIDNSAVVCFINGKGPLTCKRIFLRRLAEGTVEWREDRFG